MDKIQMSTYKHTDISFIMLGYRGFWLLLLFLFNYLFYLINAVQAKKNSQQV